MSTTETVNATEFKAKCLDILDRVHTRQTGRVAITKRGKVVAVLVPPDAPAEQVEQLYGFMRGSVIIPPDMDLTAPVLDEALAAEQGIFHE